MAVDSSIALGVQAPHFADPMEQYGKLLSMQQAINGSRLANLQIKQAQTQMDREDKLRTLLPGAVGPDGKVDYEKVAGVYNQVGMPLEGAKAAEAGLGIQQKRNELTDADVARHANAAGTLANLLGQAKDDASYKAAINAGMSDTNPLVVEATKQFAAQNPDFNPVTVGAAVSRTISHKDQLEIEARNRGLDIQAQGQKEQGRHNLAMEGNAALENSPQHIQEVEAAKARGQMQGMGGSGAAGAAGVSGEDYLKTLDPQTAATVKALSEGRMQIPGGFALKSPYWQNMLRAVAQYDPNFDTVNYGARFATRKDFTSGKSADNVTALNTAIAHLGGLRDAYGRLGNGRFPMANAVGNYLGQQGWNLETQRNYADVSTKAEAVAHELAKVFRNSGMSEGEINAWKERVDPNAAPESQRGVIGSALELMHGRLQALGDRYNVGMGTSKDPMDMLTPEAQKTLESLEEYVRGAGAPAAKGEQPSAPPQTNAKGWQLHRDAQGNMAYVGPKGEVEEVK